MVCCKTCTTYTTFRVLLLNLMASWFNFLMNCIAFATTQWAVSDQTRGGCKNYIFIGLKKSKYGVSGCSSEGYDIYDVTCEDIQLTGSDCTTFENAVSYAQIALACCIIIPVIKTVLVRVSYDNKHNRVLWFSMFVLLLGDVFLGCMAFAAIGDFRWVMSEMPSFGDSPSVGYGWGLELFSGFIAFFTAFLALIIIINRVGEDVHEKIFKEENPRTMRQRLDDMWAYIVRWWKHALGFPARFKRQRAARAERLKREKEHEEELKTRDTRNIYWGPDGNLWTGRSIRNRDEELLDILENDTYDESDNSALWMIMPSRWLRRWLMFCKFKIGEEPGKISMMLLMVKDPSTPSGYRPKKTLKPPNYTHNEDPTAEDHPGHYRRVTLEVWLKFLDIYGADGPALAVLGIPYDELARWSVFVDPRNIDTSVMAPPVIPVEEDNDKNVLTGALGGVTGALGGLFGGSAVEKA